MSVYPDANYAGTPDYNVTSGTNCENAKPYYFWKGATFCEDVDIQANLTVAGNITAATGLIGKAQFGQTEAIVSVPVTIDANTVIKGRLITDEIQVKEIEFRAVRLPPFDNYYVLASYIPSN